MVLASRKGKMTRRGPRQTTPVTLCRLYMMTLVLSWSSLPTCFAASRLILTIVGDLGSSYDFRAELADFGNPLDDNFAYAARLMTPPGDAQMCDFPKSLTDNMMLSNSNNSNSFGELMTPIYFQAPIALLVSLGGCDIEAKVAVAMDIFDRVSKAIRYIVFYNNDPNNPDDIFLLKGSMRIQGLQESSSSSSRRALTSIAFISVSAQTGSTVLERMDNLANNTGTSSTFLASNNMRWHLQMVLERVDFDSYKHSGSYPSSGFYWFRFVLFTLLIVSPCCRAGYLWYAGGARIQFRRNENGRIVGLQYIPPASYWFTANTGHESATPISDRLTEDQVLALPEIIYKPSEVVCDSKETESFTEHDGDDDDQVETVVRIRVESGSADAQQAPKESIISGESSNNYSTENSPSGNPVTDEEQPDERQNDNNLATTNCTTCSICIDEFEEGERIRLLPRCKHAFHTDCIMPWLTERQGCCPLCKSSVLEPEGVDDNNNAEDEAVSNTDEVANNASIHSSPQDQEDLAPQAEQESSTFVVLIEEGDAAGLRRQDPITISDSGTTLPTEIVDKASDQGLIPFSALPDDDSEQEDFYDPPSVECAIDDKVINNMGKTVEGSTHAETQDTLDIDAQQKSSEIQRSSSL